MPVLTPRLASLWVGFVTPVPSGIARPLVGSLVHEVVCAEHDLDALVGPPPGGALGYDDAVAPPSPATAPTRDPSRAPSTPPGSPRRIRRGQAETRSPSCSAFVRAALVDPVPRDHTEPDRRSAAAGWSSR